LVEEKGQNGLFAAVQACTATPVSWRTLFRGKARDGELRHRNARGRQQFGLRAAAFAAGCSPQTAGAARSPVAGAGKASHMNCAPGSVSTKTATPSNRASERSNAILTGTLTGMMRFYYNKVLYGFSTRIPIGSVFTGDEHGLVRQARAAVTGSSGTLPYCVSRDGRGILRGGQPAWMYLRDFALRGPRKSAIIRRLLAQLPSNVSFHFVCSPDLPDAALVRQAFHSAGFRLLDVETNIYTPPTGHTDLIDTFSGKSIKGTLRRAKRDLDVVDISVRDYFRFQRANLASSGKKNYRNDNLDQLMLEEALRRKSARILAARRRSTDVQPGPNPIDAAIVCLWDETASLFKLWRLTHRVHSYGPVMPHVDASKLLILAAMQEAADRKTILETDGSTPGLAKLYALFGPGIFQRTTRLQCERETLWALLNRLYPSLSRRLGAVVPTAGPNVSELEAEIAVSSWQHQR